MRRKKGNIFKNLSKKILHRKFLIKFIVVFSILELLFIPFSSASFISTDDLDVNTKTDGSESSPPAIGNEPSDTNSDKTIVNDNPTDNSGDSTSADNIPTDSNGDSFLVDDKTTNSNESSLVNDNNFYFAPNERIVPTNEIISKIENTLGDLIIGLETEVKLGSFEDIDAVKLTPAKNLEEVKVTIIKLIDKPEEIIDSPKKNVSIYKYLDIKLVSNDTYVKEDELNSLEFKFKVEKTWIFENRINKSTIKLIRYHNGVWQNLSTTLNNENETYIYYTALSPGFSTFAIVGTKVVEKSESYKLDDVSIPWPIIFVFITVLTIMLVFILFKARYIYLKDENK